MFGYGRKMNKREIEELDSQDSAVDVFQKYLKEEVAKSHGKLEKRIEELERRDRETSKKKR